MLRNLQLTVTDTDDKTFRLTTENGLTLSLPKALAEGLDKGDKCYLCLDAKPLRLQEQAAKDLLNEMLNDSSGGKT